MPEDYVIVYVGADAQPLQDQIKVGGRPLNLGSSDVFFKLREAQSDVIKVSASAVVTDSAQGEVSYDWVDSDLDTTGEYYGWWLVDTGDGELHTTEFLVIIAEHAPGQRTRTGAIYRKAKAIIPITWDALEKFPDYGDSLLQEKIEVVKNAILGSGTSSAEEATLDILVQDYLAKLAVIQVIPAGVDYWNSKPVTQSVAPTTEIVTYPDRIESLWKIYERLLIQVEEDATLVDEILDNPTKRSFARMPAFSPGTEDGFKTPLPGGFRDYHFPDTPSWWD